MIRSRKAISPVIATVILVAVAVVIAAAFAGFASGIFASSSTVAVDSAVDLYVLSDGTGGVSLKNTGAADDKLISIQVSPNDPIIAPFSQACQGNCHGHGHHFGWGNGNGHHSGGGNQAPDSAVPANSIVDIPWDKSLGDFGVGQTVEVMLKMQSGATLTQETTVEDANG